MFDFSVFQTAFRRGTKNRTSRIHNMSYWNPILKFDTSMNLWLNFITLYIQIFRKWPKLFFFMFDVISISTFFFLIKILLLNSKVEPNPKQNFSAYLLTCSMANRNMTRSMGELENELYSLR